MSPGSQPIGDTAQTLAPRLRRAGPGAGTGRQCVHTVKTTIHIQEKQDQNVLLFQKATREEETCRLHTGNSLRVHPVSRFPGLEPCPAQTRERGSALDVWTGGGGGQGGSAFPKHVSSEPQQSRKGPQTGQSEHSTKATQPLGDVRLVQAEERL